MADFVDGTLDFTSELLPLDEAEGGAADGQRGFDFSAVELGAEAFTGLLAGCRGGLDLVFQLLQFLVQDNDVSEMLGGVVTNLYIGGGTFLHVAEIHDAFNFDRGLLELVGHVYYDTLYQGRTADGLLHA